MGNHYDSISPDIAQWIGGQKMFFVSTAHWLQRATSTAPQKVGISFRILGPTEVAYQDYTGSGAETRLTFGKTVASSSCSAPLRARPKSSACMELAK